MSKRPQLDEPVEIAKMWKSPRNRRHTIHLVLREYEGHAYLDIRTFTLNAQGQAVPTKAGVTVTPGRLEEFSAGVAKAVAKAREIGLISEGEGDE
ncbi:transcriptional coactivator p15/PC4 family protein [Bradyrhizobium sp. DASA03076]|uniref:transcriptional coactivator p15/PC4 family protein n=1 Tax=Bradyrhizobium sp. BLXBL-03 TaxID=3395916 RepID=UPI003F7280A2